MAAQTNLVEKQCYRIVVKGVLDRKWVEWFNGLRIEPFGDGFTQMTGLVTDQAALHGILGKIRDLGLPLISLRQVEDEMDKILPEFKP